MGKKEKVCKEKSCKIKQQAKGEEIERYAGETIDSAREYDYEYEYEYWGRNNR